MAHIRLSKELPGILGPIRRFLERYQPTPNAQVALGVHRVVSFRREARHSRRRTRKLLEAAH